MGAIRKALQILAWHEHMDEDEVPPKRIWLDEEKLRDWMDDVKANRKAKAEGDSSGGSRSEMDPDGYVQNGMTEGLRGRR